MDYFTQWISDQIKYKEDLNEKYRGLAQIESLYNGRILFGSGYIQALIDVQKQLKKDDINDIPQG